MNRRDVHIARTVAVSRIARVRVQRPQPKSPGKLMGRWQDREAADWHALLVVPREHDILVSLPPDPKNGKSPQELGDLLRALRTAHPLRERLPPLAYGAQLDPLPGTGVVVEWMGAEGDIVVALVRQPGQRGEVGTWQDTADAMRGCDNLRLRFRPCVETTVVLNRAQGADAAPWGLRIDAGSLRLNRCSDGSPAAASDDARACVGMLRLRFRTAAGAAPAPAQRTPSHLSASPAQAPARLNGAKAGPGPGAKQTGLSATSGRHGSGLDDRPTAALPGRAQRFVGSILGRFRSGAGAADRGDCAQT
eukprot:gene26457-66106_t